MFVWLLYDDVIVAGFNEAAGELPLSLDFLIPRVTYAVTFYEDAPRIIKPIERAIIYVKGRRRRGLSLTPRLLQEAGTACGFGNTNDTISRSTV